MKSKLSFTLFASLLGLASFLSATPHPNNSKSKAITISIFDGCVWGSLTSPYSYNLTNTTADERSDGVWYKFTPTLRGFEISRQSFQVKVEVLCDDPSVVITERQVPSNGIAYEVSKLNIPYYIKFTNHTADIFNFCLYTSAGNDEKVNAELVTDGKYCIERNFVFSNSTKSSGSFSCKSFDKDYQDIWYKFIATSISYTLTARKATSQSFSIAVIDSVSGAEVDCKNGLFGTRDDPNAKAVINLNFLALRNTYYIKVLNYSDNGDKSLNLCLQPKITTIEETNVLATLVYPNPSTGLINIDTQEEIKQVKLTNTLGQQELFYSSSFSSLFNGLVIIEILYKNGTVSKNKVLIQ